jgi:hypothetical protein
MNRFASRNLVFEARKTVLKREAWDLARKAIENIPPVEDKETAWALAELVDAFRRLCRRCLDCKKPSPEIFMVTDDLWDAYGCGSKLLCITCFTKRVPRPLTATDFKHVPCNELLFFGSNLAP